MSLTRRQVIEAGASAGGLALLGSSPLLASALPSPAKRKEMRATPPHEPQATQPARARVAVDPDVDPRIVARARAAFDRHRSRIARADVVGIVDFSKMSNVPRFYLLDTNSGRVTRHYVSHGRGSDPGHTGFLQQFSNRIGSEATSEGAYLVGAYYEGQYGRSMRLTGLDHTNYNAYARAIVVHPAWYAEPSIIQTQGRLGRSEGCFSLSAASHRETLARLGPGHFLYAARAA
ncbi:MAG: murein L,D-transpeptidase catalytic domain family protein [Sphingomonas sp.]